MSVFSQESNTNLLFQFFGINENQFELDYISSVLGQKNITAEKDLEAAVLEIHKYYIEHQEEIQTTVKANELIAFRNAGKKEQAEMWSQALSSIGKSLAIGFPAAIEAGNQQQIEYQKKINRDNEIQAYITQHSSKATKQYTQVFGDMPTGSNAPQAPRVTTSNGLEDPLPSAKSFETGPESETMGVIIENGVRQSVRLKVDGDRLESMLVGDPFVDTGNRSWLPVGKNGIPTEYKTDGEISKLYKYKVMVRSVGLGLKTIYFNK